MPVGVKPTDPVIMEIKLCQVPSETEKTGRQGIRKSRIQGTPRYAPGQLQGGQRLMGKVGRWTGA